MRKTLTSNEVPDLVIGQRIVMAASGGNFSYVTQSLKVEREENKWLADK